MGDVEDFDWICRCAFVYRYGVEEAMRTGLCLIVRQVVLSHNNRREAQGVFCK